jgi:hypothetical protein
VWSNVAQELKIAPPQYQYILLDLKRLKNQKLRITNKINTCPTLVHGYSF